MSKILIIVSCVVLALCVFQACKEDEKPDPDKALFAEVNTATGYTYYQSGTILPTTFPSPHGDFKLRFNATAASALDGTGELPSGGTFPTGSILVKEVQTGGSTSLYAVIKKDPSNSNANMGWVWAELSLDGSAVFSTTRKGDGCVPCHSSDLNRDLSKTFDLH